jgi:predicted RND superfamily exporter protein
VHFLFTYRWFFVCGVITFCLSTASYVKKAIAPNNALSIWFKQNDPALVAYNQFQDDFGNDRIITIAFKEKGGILQLQVLKQLQRFSLRLSNVQGVKEVSSLLTTKDFRRVRDGADIKIKWTTYFEDGVHFGISPDVQKELLASPMMVNRFINAKGDVAMVVLQLDSLTVVEDNMKVIMSDIEEAASPYPGKENIHIGGTDVINEGLNKLSERDFGLFTGLAFLLMFLITGIVYRNLLYLLLVLLISVSTVWISLAVHGMLGYRIHIFSIVAPPLVITLSIIGVLHIVNAFENALQQNEASRSPLLLAKEALLTVFKPALYATLTTAIGFASLLTSPTAALKEFGILSCIGVLLSFLFSFLFSSLILPMHQHSHNAGKKHASYGLGVFSRHILKHAFFYTCFCFIIVVLCMGGINQIKNDMDPIGYFPKQNSVVKDHEFLLKNWGAYFPIDMVLKLDDTVSLEDSRVTEAILNFDQEIVSNPIVKNSFAFTTIMQRHAQVAFKKPLQDLVKDPLLSYLYVHPYLQQLKKNPSGLVTPDLRNVRITFTGPLLSIRTLEKNLTLIDNAAKRHFQGLGHLTVAGYPSLYIKIMNYAFDSMRSSMYSCFLLIALAMLLMLRRIRTTLIVLVPNIFPLVFLLGFLGWSGINLDLATCTVTAIVMGIVIDDTIYFIHYYSKLRRLGMGVAESIQQTHLAVGKVILLSSIVLVAGFSVMLLASLKTVVYFGLLAIVSVIAALLSDLVILPLLLWHADTSKPHDDYHDKQKRKSSVKSE